MGELKESIRRDLLALARRRDARVTQFSRNRPTVWQPDQVRNPHGVLDQYFNDENAWELVVQKLEERHPVEEVELRRPAGKKGYVMKIQLEPDQPLLYVKLQIGSGKIFGRSFHYDR